MMKTIFLDKALKISLIIGVLLIASSVFYYLVIFLPCKEKARIELQERQERRKSRISWTNPFGIERQKNELLEFVCKNLTLMQ